MAGEGELGPRSSQEGCGGGRPAQAWPNLSVPENADSFRGSCRQDVPIPSSNNTSSVKSSGRQLPCDPLPPTPY